ncbi:MAG: glutathione S-transferase family protein [Pseudomonadota bacterium]
MKLYDAMTPSNLRVRAFLAEKGVDVRLEPVDVRGGGTRTASFLAKNSLGELPVLELDDGRILTESVAICRYLEELYPQPALLGETAFEKAHIEMWNRRVELHLLTTIGNVARHTFAFFADRIEQMPAYADTQVRAFDQAWAWFDAELADGRPFVAGDTFSIADITGMAALLVCTFADNDLPSGCSNANRWADAMRSRPSFLDAVPKAA